MLNICSGLKYRSIINEYFVRINNHCILFWFTLGLREDLIQLEQLGREWSVQVYCATVAMETVAEEMLGACRGLRLWPFMDDCENIAETLQEETAKMKDLVKCACYG